MHGDVLSYLLYTSLKKYEIFCDNESIPIGYEIN